MASGEGRGPGRLSQKVGPLNEPQRESPPGGRERIAFVTGKLAETALKDTLAGIAAAAGFDYEVITLNIAVAALMTTEWAARKLVIPQGTGRVVFPGYCGGDLEALAETAGVPVERGPKDLRELPKYFGVGAHRLSDYGTHDIEIIAEINSVAKLRTDEVLTRARHYRDDGADVIDLGCDPGQPFTAVGELVRRLREEEFRVSIDSLNPAEIRPAVEAGAELVLSVNSSNIDSLRGLDCEVVVIPDDPSSLESLDRSVEKLSAWGMRYRIDPIIEPIGFGFAQSLGRYLTVRKRYPEAEILMGIGNITELTDTDTAAVNIVLLGFCAEIGIRSVLTTEVIPWAATCVREIDIGRQLVHHAVSRKRLPKYVEPRLHLLRDEKLLQHGPAVLEKMAGSIKDRNFRIFAEDGKIHVINSEMHIEGADPFELFAKMQVLDPSHSFYLGYEMSKAITALTLGKNYVQDEALRWGFLTKAEKSHFQREQRGRGKIEN